MKLLEKFQENSGNLLKICKGYPPFKGKKSIPLQKILKKENINPAGTPKILVYNSPYKFINRRNEILIPITFKPKRND